MAVYDSTGREVMAMRWDAIADIPDRVLEIAALLDPNALRYVGWDDAANELALLAFDAADIPYDNTTSGLTATEVQAAIDEIAAGAGAGTIFSGHVDFAGSGAGSRLPVGWTVSRPATGLYTITHSLALSDIHELSIVATCVSSHPSSRLAIVQTNPTINSFQIGNYDVEQGIAGGGGRVNEDFYFIATLNIDG